jgi:hypothetical protein
MEVTHPVFTFSVPLIGSVESAQGTDGMQD